MNYKSFLQFFELAVKWLRPGGFYSERKSDLTTDCFFMNYNFFWRLSSGSEVTPTQDTYVGSDHRAKSLGITLVFWSLSSGGEVTPKWLRRTIRKSDLTTEWFFIWITMVFDVFRVAVKWLRRKRRTSDLTTERKAKELQWFVDDSEVTPQEVKSLRRKKAYELH